MEGGMWEQFKQSGIGRQLKDLDEGVRTRAEADVAVAQEAAMRRRRDYLENSAPDVVAREVASSMNRPVADVQQELNSLGRDAFLDQVMPHVNRGRGGFGKRGLREQLSHDMASNRYVRRGAYPALIAGGAVAGGAGLTEGAQQLMALMDFMQQGQETVQRVEESPLA